MSSALYLAPLGPREARRGTESSLPNWGDHSNYPCLCNALWYPWCVLSLTVVLDSRRLSIKMPILQIEMRRCINIFNNLDIAGTNQSEELEKGSLRSPVIKILPLRFVGRERSGSQEGLEYRMYLGGLG